MSKIIKTIGVAVAAAAVISVGVGTASAGTAYQDTASHPAKAAQTVSTRAFEVSAGKLPQGTYLVLHAIEGNTIGGLHSGPAVGSTLQSNGMQDYEVTWFKEMDNDIRVTYDLYKNKGVTSTDTGNSVMLNFDVNKWDLPPSPSTVKPAWLPSSATVSRRM